MKTENSRLTINEEPLFDMKIKTAELQGAALDWAVEEAGDKDHTYRPRNYSTDWAQGGPIIEREEMGLEPMTEDGCDGWLATCCSTAGVHMEFGPTPLIAAMRCYVATKLGNEVDVPEGLV